jgi:2-polyprenyl-6-methoxyphenol hydroxylase-like FAD-dependent oxidoreductase
VGEPATREFRGDSVHPSTLELIHQLGLLERLLQLPHAKVADFPVHLPDGRISPPSRPNLPTRFSESLQVPQAVFLDLLAEAASAYPTFHLATGARVEQLVAHNGSVRGVRYRARDGWHEVHARLVVGADGRFSRIRQLAGIALHESAQAIDVLWLRLPKSDTDPPRAGGTYPGLRELLVVGDHGDVWQIGLAFPKGSYQELRNAGISALRTRIGRLAPWLLDRTMTLQDWRETSLLVARSGRVRRWHMPGLLLIGDAAHVMSPVFGVGINYAIQDAIVASNKLGPSLLRGDVRRRELGAVQRRREWPTRLMQLLQNVGEHQVLGVQPTRSARCANWLMNLPVLRPARARLIAFGGWHPERAADPPAQQVGPRRTSRPEIPALLARHRIDQHGQAANLG